LTEHDMSDAVSMRRQRNGFLMQCGRQNDRVTSGP